MQDPPAVILPSEDRRHPKGGWRELLRATELETRVLDPQHETEVLRRVLRDPLKLDGFAVSTRHGPGPALLGSIRAPGGRVDWRE